MFPKPALLVLMLIREKATWPNPKEHALDSGLSGSVHGALEETADATELRLGPDGLWRRGGGELKPHVASSLSTSTSHLHLSFLKKCLDFFDTCHLQADTPVSS